MLSKETLTRIISGLLLSGGVLLILFLAPPVAFTGLMLVVALIAGKEFYDALLKKQILVSRGLLFLNTFFIGGAFLEYHTQGLFYASLGLIGIYIIVFILSKMFDSGLPNNAHYYCIQVAWIVFPCFAAAHIRENKNALTMLLQENAIIGSMLFLMLIFAVSFNDIWAYFGGKNFGKHKLAPSISPNKTIEGSVFGIIGALVGGLGFTYFKLGGLSFAYFDKVSWIKSPVIELTLLLLILAVAGQIGDLVESKFKRFCGVKDSGVILPGHGGVLDRLDAYLFVIPIFFAYTFL
ncbi:MAG: phosphatidate cytidylyltransferase [bacterium]|jgi:phosphatidate cytidylyltransferase